MYDDDRLDCSTRVLSLLLPEAQWRALLDVEPEPVAWLRQQIVERLEAKGRTERGDVAPASRAS